MSAPLLGLPLELARQELSDRGVTQVAVNRLRAPRRAHPPDEGGEWRVVRASEGEAVTLDVCRFAEVSLVGAATGRPPEMENTRTGGD